MTPYTWINNGFRQLSRPLKWLVVTTVVAVCCVFVSIVAILAWREGTLATRLGLAATKADIEQQTSTLAAADSAKMTAIAEQAAAAVRDELVALMDEKEVDARHTVLTPLLEEVKLQRRDINTLFGMVQAQGREVRALPGQFSRDLEEILEASKPPKTDAQVMQEMFLAQQAKTDSLIELLRPKPKKLVKAPAM